MLAATKPHNSGKWTAARFHSFVKSALRSASNRWPPKTEVLKAARVERGVYKCAGYQRNAHKVPASLPGIGRNGARGRNVFVDHIEPVVDPVLGFQSWDEVVARLFCEKDGMQLLCKQCHDKKTADERVQRKLNA